MKELPIIFSTHMVQAILDGRKTQTRRIVKPQPTKSKDREGAWDYCYGKKGWGINIVEGDMLSRFLGILSFSKYKPGDLLWVREAYSPHYFEFGVHGYKSDWQYTSGEYAFKPRWKPSIHMPKDAARIWLKVVNVRVERLMDISEEDAKAEGVEPIETAVFGQCWENYGPIDADAPYFFSPVHSFMSLWESINGVDSAKQNPWVWVIEFEVVSKTGRP